MKLLVRALACLHRRQGHQRRKKPDGGGRLVTRFTVTLETIKRNSGISGEAKGRKYPVVHVSGCYCLNVLFLSPGHTFLDHSFISEP